MGQKTKVKQNIKPFPKKEGGGGIKKNRKRKRRKIDVTSTSAEEIERINV